MSYPNNQTFLKDGLAKIVATSLLANPTTRRILTNTEKWVGDTLKQPVKYQANSAFTTFTGLALLPTNQVQTTVNMEFTMKSSAMSIALGGDELSIALSDTSITDKLKYKLQEAQVDMSQRLGAIFYGNGVGSDFNGMGNIVDDGSTAATIGGLSRTTYPTLKATVTSSGGTLTTSLMASTWNTISDNAIQPNLLTCNGTVNGLYEKIAQVFNTYQALAPGQYDYNVGAGSLRYKGVPVLVDKYATAQTLFFLNMDFMKFYHGAPVSSMGEESIGGQITEMEGVPDKNMSNLGFIWSGWKQAFNQNAMVGYIYLRGELVPTDPGHFGKITGITTS